MIEVVPSAANMLSVLKLFLIPVGGGIPAGVMLSQAKGVAWPVMTLLYLVSDIVLALAFEPVLRLIALICGEIAFLARISAVLKAATARSVSHFSGTGAGPIGLIMIAFGVDPMTGRASAHAAGHGFIAGWAIAIAGDMLYFAVIALTTLSLNTYIRDPDTTMYIILAAMFVVPMLIRRIRSSRLFIQGSGPDLGVVPTPQD
ncbi:hypothetical protein [Pelobacter propionicus]|uniref:Uncharacterized protein n=1 Tax=Pelobacter propionicus (strain DSM 2379 / NBRC 103807 / OttBd1) TaxID=338966 RepID=A1AQ93_PELPD|nr:hypothetical protein [Pelobacter propionicus]ABK99513.1 conserved hypothetical protein [Pelobacter propionicus DSM 2379]